MFHFCVPTYHIYVKYAWKSNLDFPSRCLLAVGNFLTCYWGKRDFLRAFAFYMYHLHMRQTIVLIESSNLAAVLLCTFYLAMLSMPVQKIEPYSKCGKVMDLYNMRKISRLNI